MSFVEKQVILNTLTGHNRVPKIEDFQRNCSICTIIWCDIVLCRNVFKYLHVCTTLEIQLSWKIIPRFWS